MLDLLAKGTDRGYSMIGVGLSAGLSGSRRARTVQDPLPALDLDWATNRSLPASYGPTPTFTRASTGTYFDGQGILQTAAVNGPRFNHVYNGTSWISKGLLIESQGTNLLSYSQNLANAYWAKSAVSISSAAAVSPDGTSNAEKIVESATTAYHSVNKTGITTSGAATVSIYMKAAGRNYASLEVIDNYRAVVNLTDGTVVSNSFAGSTLTATNVGNGWYRFVYTGTGIERLIIYSLNSSSFGSYAGDGSSGVYAWGAQIENGALVSSYIPSTASSTVRSSSVCQISGSDFSGIWNASEGTLVIEGDSVASSTTPFLCLDDNTSSERIEIYGSGTDPKVIVVDGGSTQVDIDAGTISNGTAFKLAFAYKLNDFAVSLNGGAVATDAAGTLPTVDRLRIGSNQAGNYLNGHIARLRYYPTRLTNTKLQELST